MEQGPDPLRELVNNTEAQKKASRLQRVEYNIRLLDELTREEHAYDLLISEPHILEPLKEGIELLDKVLPGTFLSASRPYIASGRVIPAMLRLWVTYTDWSSSGYRYFKDQQFSLNSEGKLVIKDPYGYKSYGLKSEDYFYRVLSPESGIDIRQFPNEASKYFAQFGQDTLKYIGSMAIMGSSCRVLSEREGQLIHRRLRWIVDPSARDWDQVDRKLVYIAPYSYEDNSYYNKPERDKLIYPAFK